MLRSIILMLLVQASITHVFAMPPSINHDSAKTHAMPEQVADTGHDSQETSILDIRSMSSIDDIAQILAAKRVIHVGEAHNKYSHHLAQLDIIRAIHTIHPDLAIGMEMFQQPFQQYLDQYIKGELDETEMLRHTEYFSRWKFDFRLYKPILDYAKEHRIPVIALNIEKEITSKVGDVGIDGLDETESQKIPADIDDSDTRYRRHLQQVFSQHPRGENSDFERFLQVQLLWDEGMAERTAEYLRQYPDRKMVVLAGVGHVAHGMGIPARVKRRINVDSAIVLPGDASPIEPGIADFIIYPRSVALPQAGQMGIFLGDGGDKGVEAKELFPEGAAAKAGVKKGDKIFKINNTSISSHVDIKLALLNMSPGQEVTLHVNRKKFLWGNRQLEFTFELGP